MCCLYMQICMYVYIYIYIYEYTFNMIENLWISNLRRTLGFPGPRWMHVPTHLNLGSCASSEVAGGLGYFATSAPKVAGCLG